MKFEPKISGTSVTEFIITPIFHKQIVSLAECLKVIQRQEAMDFLLDTFRFSLCKDGGWRAVLDWDSIMKLTVLENYPQYEQEFIDHFGEDWTKYYIRFNH